MMEPQNMESQIPANALEQLYEIAMDRKANFQQQSYTCYLFTQGQDKILKKCGEECSEMIIAAKNDNHEELANEIADLFYHVMVLCAEKGLPYSQVEEVLQERSKKIGNLKQFHITDKNT